MMTTNTCVKYNFVAPLRLLFDSALLPLLLQGAIAIIAAFPIQIPVGPRPGFAT